MIQDGKCTSWLKLGVIFFQLWFVLDGGGQLGKNNVGKCVRK